MKYFFVKIKKHIRTLVQFTAVFGAAFLVLLYFLGYYDFSFLERYNIFNDELPTSNSESTSQNPFASIDISEITDEASPDTTNESVPPDISSPSASDTPQKEAPDNTRSVYSPDALPDRLTQLSTVSKLTDAGYKAVSADGSHVFDSSTVLGKMTFDFKLPERFANRERSVVDVTVVTPGENGEDTSLLTSDEKYVVTKTVREERPAVELYMGYIILDDGHEFFLLSSDGTPLCRYDAEMYKPAYTRDRENRPLFMREKDGKNQYYYFSADGESGARFVLSDYDPETDSRGLNFDYPASWGISDSTSVFVVTNQTEDNTPTNLLFGYEVRDGNDEVKGQLTGTQFTSAYPFMQNRAAVTTTKDRGSQYFINQDGNKAFVNTQTYLNEHERYVTEYLLPPLTNGIESMGFYYYDHGLVRARRQVIDYWNYFVRGLTRVVKDYDCLLRTDGTEYTLPKGFELTGYSDGMALLMQNGAYGVFDVAEGWKAQPIYISATPYISGLSVLTLPDRRCGLIDKSGAIVLPFTYDHISISGNLVLTYRVENGWTVYKMMESQ